MSEVPTPALATLTHERFWRDGWVYERKLDGQRCLAVCEKGGTTQLYSRTGRRVTGAFPEVAEALQQGTDGEVMLDGEVVAFEGARTSFARLQPRMQVTNAEQARRSGVRVYFYLFDVLQRGRQDLRGEPLLARKRALRSAVTFTDPLRYTPHRVRADDTWFARCCERGWEGVIAKRADAPYASGRTKDWLKFKCEAGQELVVVGWSEPSGSREAIGALLLGYVEDGVLVYAGKVGTGFSEAELHRLYGRLSPLERPDPAPGRGSLPSSGVHWVEPQLVAQVAFTEWTAEGRLRHPRYLGLRTDKAAEDVVRE